MTAHLHLAWLKSKWSCESCIKLLAALLEVGSERPGQAGEWLRGQGLERQTVHCRQAESGLGMLQLVLAGQGVEELLKALRLMEVLQAVEALPPLAEGALQPAGVLQLREAQELVQAMPALLTQVQSLVAVDLQSAPSLSWTA